MRAGYHEPTLAERLWPRVRVVDSGCWEWTGSRDNTGYGTLGIGGGRFSRAHRVAWLLSHLILPQGAMVCHHCDNPPCCNPDHLFLGSTFDNSRDMVAKGRARGRFRSTSTVAERLERLERLEEELAALKDALARCLGPELRAVVLAKASGR